MLFELLVQASAAVQQTRSRLRKVQALATCIAGAHEDGPEALEASVSFLAGELPRGRIGLGPATVFGEPLPAPRAAPELTIADVAAALAQIQAVSGPGSVAERLRRWNELLGRATESEQLFLRRLVVGELRQGALESLVALIATTGNFSMTCMVANSFEVDPPADNPTPLAG